MQDPPRLAEPDKWSPEMSDFVEKCLQKDPTMRSTPQQLLKVSISRIFKSFELIWSRSASVH